MTHNPGTIGSLLGLHCKDRRGWQNLSKRLWDSKRDCGIAKRIPNSVWGRLGGLGLGGLLRGRRHENKVFMKDEGREGAKVAGRGLPRALPGRCRFPCRMALDQRAVSKRLLARRSLPWEGVAKNERVVTWAQTVKEKETEMGVGVGCYVYK